MLTYFVHYEIESHYEEAVTEAIFEFLVLPCQNATQSVTNVTTINSLQNDFFRVKTVFDYEAICFRTDHPFQHLQFSASCHVHKSTLPMPPVQLLSLEEELSMLRSDVFAIDHLLYLHPTILTGLPPEKVNSRFLYHENKPLIQFLRELNELIYQLMTYRPGVATPGVATPGVATPLAKAIEILENPEGVCQDYSHLMLGLLRYNGIPCRYVSGYLHQGQDFVGSAQMHAWIEAYIPNAGWVGFDPTYNREVDEHYIKVADGLDYEDCRPLKEFLHTNSLHRTRSALKVIDQQQQ